MKKILIVIDMQNDFTTGVLGNKECEAAIDAVKNCLKDDYDQVIFTRDTHQDNYMETQEGRRLPVPHCIEGSDGWDVVKSLKDEASNNFSQEDITYFNKPTFGSLELGQLLRERYLNLGADVELTYVGVCTGICVISNVAIAKAALPEATVRVLSEACACVTIDTHQTALNAMKTIQVDVL